jgi:hypothetical protein
LAAHDEPAYRQTCAAAVQQSLVSMPERDPANRTAWFCSVRPDAGVDTAQVVRIAERAVAVNAKDPDYLLALGAALYRAGRFDAAARTLADAEAAYHREETTPTPGIVITMTVTYSQLFLAMTHRRLEHLDEATQWMKKAIEGIDRVPPATQPHGDRLWRRRLTSQLLRREAEALFAHIATKPATN